MLILAAAAAAAIGCAKQPEVGSTTPAGPTTVTPPAGPAPAPTAQRPSETAVRQPPAPRETTLAPATPTPTATSPLKDAFFEYDRALLTDEAKAVLNEDVAWLKANPRAQVTVEGHCDERGTSEYNLGLGDRRAKAVREYLVAAGVDGGRIRTISYGKERPFVQGHDESAWRWNRRAHFVIAGQ
ncbi:MAG TPA: peptidoglycan-associated lipoprotein Pal [Candidatus Methylomirabilis sp.]|jgi:peptidoglycan-associated lipoprotein